MLPVILILCCALSFISGNHITETVMELKQYLQNADSHNSHHYYELAQEWVEKNKHRIKRELEVSEFSHEKMSRKKRGTFKADPSVIGMLGITASDEQSTESSCSMCITIMSLVKSFLEGGSTDEDLVELAILLCQSMTNMSPTVCSGLLSLHGPSLMKILRISPLSIGQMCNLFMRTDCEELDPATQWKVQLPKTKKPKPCDVQLPKKNPPKLKALLISDHHVDPEYKEGAWAECTMPLCCRDEIGEPLPNSTLAGKWGGWQCDPPRRTIKNLFEHLAKEHPDIDYIIWTGDINPHDSWTFYKKDSISILEETVALFAEYFPNIPCFPALGNHEACPANLFPTMEVDEKFGMSWLYDELAKQWSRWLPEGCAEPIRYGGYYTVLVRPGFRIVSLNTNYCYIDNWWLLVNDKDPLGELQWLIEVLQAAEDNNEKVHIIGHVPVGSYECLKIWQSNYLEILCRYEDTITAQFFGHTHKDEFHLHFDPEDTKRICGVSHMIPSVTTYTYLNPGYKIAYVDGDHDSTTRRVLDFKSYVFDLEKANECDDYAVWTKLYSTKEAYNMSSLLPSEWKVVLDRIVTDDEFLCLYHKHYWKNSPVRPPCDEEWRRTYISYIYSYVQYGEYKNQCNS